MPAAFRHQPRAILRGPPAGNSRLHERVAFPAAEQLVRRHRRIGVVDRQRQAEGEVRGVEAVQEPAAVEAQAQRKAERVRHRADGRRVGGHFDDFLEAETVRLEMGTPQFGMAGEELACQEAGRPFRQHGPGRQNDFVLRADARHAVAVPREGVGGLAGQDFHAEVCGDLCQRAAELRGGNQPQAAHAHLGRHERQAESVPRGQGMEGVVGDQRPQRQGVEFLRCQEALERPGPQDGAGQQVSAGMRGFFQHEDGA